MVLTLDTHAPPRGLLGAGRAVIGANSGKIPTWLPLDNTWEGT